jgi:putative ABC transport system substrate-binding protein
VSNSLHSLPQETSVNKRRLLPRLLLLLLFASWCEAASGPVKLVILYPHVDGAYARVFDEIVRGVKEHARISASSVAVNNKTKPQEIELLLKKNPAQAVLALGQRSYQLSQQLTTDLPTVVGAVVTPVYEYPTISLSGDPDVFFTHLKKLAPQVKRIFIVYSEANNGWLIPRAEVSARDHGLQLVARPADNLREAVHHYRTILESAQNDTDAIWIPMDRIAPDKTILPIVLDAAWKRRLVIFCNNPLSVKRGALFALYPDHRLMGHALAELSVRQLNGNMEARVIAARNLKLAVNQRTASHLGLHYTRQQQQGFNLVYPTPR